MSYPQPSDSDRDALIRLQQHIASSRPRGVLARLKWRHELRQAEGILEWEDRLREGADPVASWRGQYLGGAALVLGVSAITGLFFSHHALTLGRAAYVLGLCAGGGLVLTGFASWSFRRMRRSGERAVQKWVERARALPLDSERAKSLPPASAV